MSAAVNLQRRIAAGPSGKPQHHPVDDALKNPYAQAMCGGGQAARP
ncbi:hypothetical protein ABT224_10995 [Streptomyces sp. NPDC001584]